MSSSTEVASEVRVPRETVNDDVVTVQQWDVKHGESVRKGDVVVHIETSKAVLEVEAESDGFIDIIHAAGAEVPIGELVGRVLTSPPSATSAGGAMRRDNGQAAGAGGSSGVTISRKARVLLDEHGIDESEFEGQGLVRERDVILYLEQRVESQTAAPEARGETGSPAPQPAQASAPATAKTGPYASRGLLGDASSAAGERGKPLVWVVWNYFWRNWLLGNLVKVAPRGVINVLHKWRGVKMGADCFIDPTATLETAYPENVTMGDDVRVTVGAIIMTHIKAPNYLRETGIMPAVVKPVVLEDHCFIGVNAVVMPGVTVGKASVVTSGSVAVSDVPPYCMVAGNPAKIIKRFPRPEDSKDPGAGDA